MSENKTKETIEEQPTWVKPQKLLDYEERLRQEQLAMQAEENASQIPEDPRAAVLARIIGCRRIVKGETKKYERQFDDLTDPEIYHPHSVLLWDIADQICMKQCGRKFVFDEYNVDVMRFMLHYFNRSKRALEIFPDRNYKLHNNLLIMGNVGTGKTMLMQIFAEYLRLTNNPNAFQNVSVTQMTNYFSMRNNIDLYTFNEGGGKGFDGQPMNICLNDIGVDNRPFYGIDTRTIVGDFLHARNEIWTQTAGGLRKFAHLTTNLRPDELIKEFSDAYGRLSDRFKTYNILTLGGPSRR